MNFKWSEMKFGPINNLAGLQYWPSWKDKLLLLLIWTENGIDNGPSILYLEWDFVRWVPVTLTKHKIDIELVRLRVNSSIKDWTEEK